MIEFNHPKKLKSGDRIAIVSPSWGGPHTFPAIYEAGLNIMRTHLELEPVEYPTARMEPDKLSRNPELRANDINTAFSDDSISGIIVSIGGDDSVRLLPYLDTELILSNPKMLMGYSDTTTLLAYLILKRIDYVSRSDCYGRDRTNGIVGQTLSIPSYRYVARTTPIV